MVEFWTVTQVVSPKRFNNSHSSSFDTAAASRSQGSIYGYLAEEIIKESEVQTRERDKGSDEGIKLRVQRGRAEAAHPTRPVAFQSGRDSGDLDETAIEEDADGLDAP